MAEQAHWANPAEHEPSNVCQALAEDPPSIQDLGCSANARKALAIKIAVGEFAFWMTPYSAH